MCFKDLLEQSKEVEVIGVEGSRVMVTVTRLGEGGVVELLMECGVGWSRWKKKI